MDLKLAGKTALVTASSGGIGLEIARRLAREGARVIVNGRSEKSVNGALETLRAEDPGLDLVGLAADNGTAEGVAETIRRFPSVDILINNLGIYEAVDFFDITDEQWERLLEVNVLSGVRLSRHYLRGMLDRDWGRVIFISSESGINPAPEMAHYSVTKTSQLSLARSLAELTKGTAVTVNSVLPGPTRSPGVEAFVKDVVGDGVPQAEAEAKFIEQNRPTSLLGRLIEPEEIADVTAFVASPLAAALNGSNVRADGGVVRSVF